MFDWVEGYRDAREATMDLVVAKYSKDPLAAKLLEVADDPLLRPFLANAVFQLLLRKYRRKKGLSRAELRKQFAEGTFWEDFLSFLQSVDWAEVIKLIMEVVTMIIGLF